LGNLDKGFGGFAWGIAREQILERRGRPEQDTAVVSGRKLAYRDRVGGRPTLTYYFIHSSDGLSSGMALISAEPARCEEVFEEIAGLVSRANPGRRQSDKKIGSRYCDGRPTSYWFRNWDEGNEVYITLSVLSDPTITLSYDGPGADARIEEASTNAAGSAPGTSRYASDPEYDIQAYCARTTESADGAYFLASACRKQEADARARVGKLQNVEPKLLTYCRDMADRIVRGYWFLVACMENEQEATAERR
jgi:hypothetical protein